MSLRIAHVTATFPPYRGGTGNVCLNNARELARRGHVVHVFTAGVPGAPAREVVDGVAVHRLGPLVRVGNAPVLPGLPGALRGFDLIHLHAPFILGAELTALAAALARAPLCVTYHNDLVPSGTWRDYIFRLATLSLRHAVLYRARRVFFVSEGHAETSAQSVVYRRRGRRSELLLNAVDTRHFRPGCDRRAVREGLGVPAEADLIGFVGGLDGAHHYKGVNVLLDALASAELSRAHLLVVGDGELRAGYAEQARRLGVADRVIFYGAVAQDALPPLYRACDVAAIPSLVPEALPLTLVEALGCGVPVVASDSPGVRSVLSDGEEGLLVRPGAPDELAAALRALLDDPERRQRMGRRGRAKVEQQFCWSERGARLEAIYERVLSEGRGRRAAQPRGEERAR